MDNNRPEIVCLCGSTRFYKVYDAQMLRLTLEGKIVLTIGTHRQSDVDLLREQKHIFNPELKAKLDELHKRKIDLADRIFVINVGGYIGESTRSEIEYAIAHNKPVEYLEEMNG